ncbi:hypothetical protein TNCV_2421171 [Trichonephila clavipes]|nr:hypothetical protein TNCV_2421171 [Trichonephila clavipes]
MFRDDCGFPISRWYAMRIYSSSCKRYSSIHCRCSQEDAFSDGQALNVIPVLRSSVPKNRPPRAVFSHGKNAISVVSRLCRVSSDFCRLFLWPPSIGNDSSIRFRITSLLLAYLRTILFGTYELSQQSPAFKVTRQVGNLIFACVVCAELHRWLANPHVCRVRRPVRRKMVSWEYLWPSLRCRRETGVSPAPCQSADGTSPSVSPKRHCCRVSAADKSCRVYRIGSSPRCCSTIFLGCTPRYKRRA